jgi:hypothetical protein
MPSIMQARTATIRGPWLNEANVSGAYKANSPERIIQRGNKRVNFCNMELGILVWLLIAAISRFAKIEAYDVVRDG